MRRAYLSFGLIIPIPLFTIKHKAYDTINDSPLHRIRWKNVVCDSR